METASLKDENAALGKEIENQQAQLDALPGYQSRIEALEGELQMLRDENERLKSGPRDSCGEILFRFDRENICEVIKQEVSETLSRVVEQNPMAIEIDGHTDPAGSEDYNLSLGQRHAESVADILVQLGMARENITITSFSERFSEEGHPDEHWRSHKVIIKVKHSQN